MQVVLNTKLESLGREVVRLAVVAELLNFC
jgi:hypothetical protein